MSTEFVLETYSVKICSIKVNIGQKSDSVRGLNDKQTTPDSSVYLRAH